MTESELKDVIIGQVAEIMELRNKLKDAELKVSVLTEKANAVGNDTFERHKIEISALNEKINVLAEWKRENSLLIKSLRDEISEQIAKANALENSNESILKNHERLEEEYKLLESKYKDAGGKYEALKKENEALKIAYKNLSAEVAAKTPVESTVPADKPLKEESADGQKKSGESGTKAKPTVKKKEEKSKKRAEKKESARTKDGGWECEVITPEGERHVSANISEASRFLSEDLGKRGESVQPASIRSTFTKMFRNGETKYHGYTITRKKAVQ